MNKQITTLKDYLNYYGNIEIRQEEKLFYSNIDKKQIGGIVKVKDIKKIGMI
jgi:hypothetical protein